MDICTAINTRRTIRDFDDRPIEPGVIEKIIGAGLKAPSNDHMRNWEFVIIDDKKIRVELLNLIPETVPDVDVNRWLDSWGAADNVQRAMYLDSVPKQHAMLFNAGALILPFFRGRDLLRPESLSSLNGFASIWCCIENMLLAAAAEGIFGVTRIPTGDEPRNIKNVIHHPDNYVMPCYIALGYLKKDAVVNKQKEVSAKEKIHMNIW